MMGRIHVRPYRHPITINNALRVAAEQEGALAEVVPALDAAHATNNISYKTHSQQRLANPTAHAPH